MTLTENHIRHVCLLGSEDVTKTCRYLMNDELEPDKWYCLKMMAEDKADIDQVVELWSSRPKSGPVPSGDNCQGYPLFKHIPQGYDVD